MDDPEGHLMYMIHRIDGLSIQTFLSCHLNDFALADVKNLCAGPHHKIISGGMPTWALAQEFLCRMLCYCSIHPVHHCSKGQSLLLGSALDITSMEADGTQPQLFSNTETMVTSSINRTTLSLSLLNETTQAPSGLQPASGSGPALHHLTSDAGPSATQQWIPATVYLEQIAKEQWGLDTLP